MQNLPRWLINGLGGLLVAFVALLVIGEAKSLSDVFGNKNPDNTISVSAEGKVKAVPDLATMTLGVVTQGDDPKEVQEENSEKINKIISYMKEQGIDKEDIATSQFNIYPRYNYREGENEIVGYQLNQTVTVKIRNVHESSEQLGKVLEGAVGNGANEVRNVSLGFDDPDELRQEARELAIAKAKEKAKELADAAGIKLGKVVSISESGGSGVPYPRYAEYAIDSSIGIGGGGGSPNIEPGSQDLIERMTVVFEVK